MKTDQYYMNKAYLEAQKALKEGEVPVGAIIVDKNGKIIGKGYNKREKSNKTIAHAEIIAINMANKKVNNWRLNDCTIYITLEPCEMCKQAINEARIKKVIYSSHSYNKNNYSAEYIKTAFLDKEIENMLKESFKSIR